jgi:nucleoside-diphosphate-sugar epimerase
MRGNDQRRTLVTGGTGFTGAHLVRRLLARGDEVLVLDNQKGRYYDELQRSGAKITIGSVTDRDLVDRLVAGCDVVHHLAAAFRKINLPKSVYWEINVNGTRYILESAKKHGVKKFVYCSTSGVHGNVKNPPAGEDAPITPADYYQYTKYEGEVVAKEFIDQKMDVTIIRPGAIYGPGDPGRWLMLFKRVAPGRFYMFGEGKTTYHPVYIDNIIDGHILAEKEEAAGQTYLITDEHYYTLNELVQFISEILDIDVKIVHLPFWPLWTVALATELVCAPFRIQPPIFRRRVDWFRQNRAFSIAKAKKELGYQARVGIKEGLSKTAQWYIDEGLLLPPMMTLSTG